MSDPAPAPDPAELFDRRRRRMARDRAARLRLAGGSADFLHRHMAEELVERLSWVTHGFSEALVIGDGADILLDALAARNVAALYADSGRINAGIHGGVQCDEDMLPFADASFDLVITNGVLDSINDLPGALALMRRVLRPDGLLLGAFIGAGSLSALKRAMLAGDGERVRGHTHPQIDVRAAGDLLARAGFAMPVADGERMTVRYAGMMTLVRDLRGMGASNVLGARSPSIGKQGLARAMQHFADAAEADGKTAETFELVYLSGWAPGPDQPQPARRGSATASLAEALKGKN